MVGKRAPESVEALRSRPLNSIPGTANLPIGDLKYAKHAKASKNAIQVNGVPRSVRQNGFP